MTITVAPTRNEYTATAGQIVFTYSFKIYAETDLNVYVTPAGQEADDIADIVTPSAVTGVGNEEGGTVTIAATSSGDLVTLVSDIPSDRTVDYQNNGDFRPEVVNNDLDRIVSLTKQIEDVAGRSLIFPESRQGVSQLALPNPEAGKLVRWRGDLSGLENVEITTIPINTNVGSVAGLRSLDINDFTEGDIVFLTGYNATGDGGNGSRRVLLTGSAPGFYIDDGWSTIVPNGGDGSAAWLAAPEIIEKDNIVSLRLQVGFYTGQRAVVLGYYIAGDGGGGPSRIWKDGDAPGTHTDDGGGTIVPTGGDGSAAWLLPANITVDMRWYGAKGDGSTDDTDAIQSCWNNQTDVTVGKGVFPITGLSISVATVRKFSGAGPGNTVFEYTGTGIAIDVISNNNPQLQHFKIINKTIGVVGARTATGLRIYGDVAGGSSIQAYLNNIRIQGFAKGLDTEGSFISVFNKLIMKQNDISYNLGRDTNSSTVFQNCESNTLVKQHIVGDKGAGATCGGTFNSCEFENAELFPYISMTGFHFLSLNDCYLYENNYGTLAGSVSVAIDLSGGGVFNVVGGGLNSAGLVNARLVRSVKSAGPYSMITITNCILSASTSGVLIDNEALASTDIASVTGCKINNAGAGTNILNHPSPLSQFKDDGTIATSLFNTLTLAGGTNDIRGNAGGTVLNAGSTFDWQNNSLVFQSQSGGSIFYLWPDTGGRLRIKTGSAPTSDTDGTVVGTQT